MTPDQAALSPRRLDGRQPSGPTVPARRIEALDIVRGFALFGVLLLNMLDFGGPVSDFEPWVVSTGWWDRTVELAIRVLGEAAFYTTFSFLFGLGFALQFERALARGERFGWRFATRLAVLGLFGLLHGFFIWDGDILLQYSVAGFFLLLFARVTSRAAPWWALGFAVFTVAVVSLLFGVALLLDYEVSTPAEIATDTAALRDGTFTAIASERLGGWLGHLLTAAVGIPWFLSLFLVGLWAVRSGKVANWRYETSFLRSVLRVSVPVAILAKGTLGLLIVLGAVEASATLGVVLSSFVGGPALGATYVCLVLLALRRVPTGTHVLRHLAPVGRMALTNYLAQSVVAVLLFYGYGLGWYGRFGVGTTIVFTIVIFAAQMVVSRWWLERFAFGPMEWVWRAMTYRSRPAVTVGLGTET